MSSLTRVGPSRIVPGAKGVFITRALKKFTPVEVAPSLDAIAPPYMINLLCTPQHTISLRRFLAMRHQFSTGMYFNIATAGGWYLVAPSGHAPLADAAGLQAWRERHHHRYAPATAKRKKDVKRGTMLSPEIDLMSSAAAGAHRRCSLPAGVREVGGEEEEEENVICAASSSAPTPPPPVASPLVISEEHLFEINDGVLWEMPPQDDLASPEYWKRHRERMQIYEDTSVSAAQEDLFADAQSTEGCDDAAGLMERERYAQQRQLFRVLTRKANVRLDVDDDTRLLMLLPVVDLQEGEELLLHYGREWWSQRLLSSLFMSVPDDEMRSVRWIEGLFARPTDVAKPFPLVCPAVALRKALHRGKSGDTMKGDKTSTANDVVASVSTSAAKATQKNVVLFNAVTRCRCTDAEALIFAVRRSCVDREFFSALVGTHGAGVFDASRCDDEVPLRYLRRVLLNALRQKQMTTNVSAAQEEEEEDGSIVL